MLSEKALGLMIVGFIIGTLSSLLGIGGGLLLVPAIVLLYHYKIHDAMAVSLAAMVPIVVLGGLIQIFVRQETIPYFPVIILILTGIVGSWLGVHWSHYLRHDQLTKLFSLLLVLLAIYVSGIFQTTSLLQVNPSFFSLLLLGILGGIISGLFGISGGVVIVPLLNQMFGYSIQESAIISLLMLGPILIAGAYFHHTKGSLDKHLLALIVPFAFLGVVLGTYLSVFLAAQVIQYIFAIILFLIAFRLYYHERKHPKVNS